MNLRGKHPHILGVTLGVVLAVFCCAAHYCIAQQPKPNLSGTWKLNGAKTIHPQWWHETRDYSLVIEHSDPKISMTHILQGAHETDLYLTDGKEHIAHSLSNSEQLQATAYWDGDALVIENYRQRGDFRVSVWTSRYEMSQDGKTLQVSGHFLKSPSSDKPFDVFRTFEKQR